jgi:hypothetical protein
MTDADAYFKQWKTSARLFKPAPDKPADSNGHDKDEQALLEEIRRGNAYHVPIVQLAGLWAHRKLDSDFAKTRVRDAFFATPADQRDARWHSRFGDIDRVVDDISKKDSNAATAQWPDPEPLIEPEDAELDYPLDALAAIILAAVKEYQAYGQQPLSLIASSALAATSLACQGLADVERDSRLKGAISLNFNTVAVSGERKTSADRHFAGPIREWQAAKRESMAAEVNDAKAELGAWEAERDGLLAKIKSASGNKSIGDKADIKAMKDSLVTLEKNKPAIAIQSTLFYEDVNAETLAVSLAEGWPSASLWSDEGGLVIGSNGMSDENLMKFVALLNRLWDGHPFGRERLHAKSAHVDCRRFTVSLMMQPIVMARLLGACEGAARNMGFVARTLTSWPTSTIGHRPYREPPAHLSAGNALAHRLKELLDKPLPTTGPQMALTPTSLPLSWQAKRIWTQFFNDIEKELSRLGVFGDVADIGSKIAENAARMAANFHVLIEQGPEGEIGPQLMEAAIGVVFWHLKEAKRIIAANRKPEAVADAALLLEWLVKQDATPIDPRDILRLARPTRLRDKACRDRALKVLTDRHWVSETSAPSRLIINPKAKSQT